MDADEKQPLMKNDSQSNYSDLEGGEETQIAGRILHFFFFILSQNASIVCDRQTFFENTKVSVQGYSVSELTVVAFQEAHSHPKQAEITNLGFELYSTIAK